MAGGLLSQLLEERGDYKVITAGVSTIEGCPPTKETIEVMTEAGLDVSGQRSRLLRDELIKEADLILVMERAHQENILSRWPDAAGKVHLLSEFGRPEKEVKLVDPDIPDPIGRPLDFYRNIFRIIRESIERIAHKLRQ